MTIEAMTGAVTNSDGTTQGAVAAADALTKTCELGKPVQIVQCDDKYSPNGGAACGRRAVSEKVLAVVGTTSAQAASFMPITTAAGIPDVGDTAAAEIQLSSPLAYPLQNAVTLVGAEAAAAKAIGAKKLVIAAINVSAIEPILALAKASALQAGLEYADPILVPPTATDLSQYAAQVTASGADAVIPILNLPLANALIKTLHQGGADFEKFHIIEGGTVFGPTEVKTFGSIAEGINVISAAWPSSDLSNAGIKQYNDELEAAGQTNVSKTVSSVVAWSSVHIVADLLKGSATMDAKTLVTKLNSSGLTSRPELAPFNFSTSAFPGDPLFGKLRAFSNQVVVSRVVNGVIKPITNGYVNFTKPFTVTS